MLLGNGDGTFQAARNYAESAVVGDFNGDGSLDVLMGNSLLPGNGNDAGTFPGLGNWFLPPLRWATSTATASGTWRGRGPSGAAQRRHMGRAATPTSVRPSITINDRTVAEGNTGTVAANFTVTLSAASTEAITIAYATGNGTATAGSDYWPRAAP